MPLFLSSKPPARAARTKLVVPDKTKAGPRNAAQGGISGATSWIAAGWLLLALLLCAGLGAGWFYGVRALRAQLTALHPVPVGAGAIRMDAFQGAPWVTEHEVADLTKELGELLTPDPLDGAALAKVARRLEGHLAVQKVLDVSRDDGGLVRITALCYAPAGLVAAEGKLLPVDAEGHLLSADGLTAEAAAKLPIPVVEGVTTASPYCGENKAVWKDPGLRAALRLVLHLPPDERVALRRIVLGSEAAPGGKPRTTLALRFEPRGLAPFEVFWGLPIGEEKGVDGPAEDKLRALRDLCGRPDLLAAATPPARFNVRSGSAKQFGLPEPTVAKPAGKPRTP